MNEEKFLTKDQLAQMEKKPRTKVQVMLDYLLCVLPSILGVLVIFQYYNVENVPGANTTIIFPVLIGFFSAALFLMFILSLFSKKVYEYLRYKAPFYAIVFVLFYIYDYLTLKTGTLILPYFPWPDRVLSAMAEDRAMLMDCVYNSLKLLFSGYFLGAAAGLITGILAGWNKKVNYWVTPVMKLLGPIPSTTWLPLIMVVAASLYKGSVFIIALGVWYPVTLSSLTGISNVKKSFYEAAATLGAKGNQLVFRVAIPAAMPSIFQGLTSGMSVACSALLVAEMMGVKSGLGWYITWQKSWAEFAKMYGAIIMICITFTVVNFLFNTVKKRVLRWQEGTVK